MPVLTRRRAFMFTDKDWEAFAFRENWSEVNLTSTVSELVKAHTRAENVTDERQRNEVADG